MGAVLTKVLRKYDLKLLAGSSAAVFLVASQQQRLFATCQVLQRLLEKYPLYCILKRFAVKMMKPPTALDVAKWDKFVLGALLVPVACSIAHSAMPRQQDDSLLKAQESETSKRFRELQEITQLSFAENKALLDGLLEFDPKESTFSVPLEPSKRNCKMPADKPLEDRLRCTRVATLVHKADECKPNDRLVSHALIVSSAALVYELDYVRRETIRWYPALGALEKEEGGEEEGEDGGNDEEEEAEAGGEGQVDGGGKGGGQGGEGEEEDSTKRMKGKPKIEKRMKGKPKIETPKIEKYRSGKELEELVQVLSVHCRR
jgi:hypothetical protein